MAGHGEKGEGIIRGNMFQFTLSQITDAHISGVGMVKLSGTKLYLSDGTDWNLITSA